MAGKGAAGATAAEKALRAAGVSFTAHRYTHDPAVRADGVGFGAEAAQALGVDPTRVFKTLVVDLGSGRLGVVIIPVLERVDLKAAASAFGAKRLAMADPAVAERSTGMVVGGISPIGQRRALPTVLDESALRHTAVLVSGGRRGLDFELAPADLVRATAARVAPLVRAAAG